MDLFTRKAWLRDLEYAGGLYLPRRRAMRPKNLINGVVAGGAAGGGGGVPAITVVAHAAAGSTDTNVATTMGINTTGAALLVVGVASYQGAAEPVVTDSVSSTSNSWTALNNYSATAGEMVNLFFCANPTVGSGHAFTATQTGSACSIYVAGFSNIVTTSPADVENGQGGSSSVTGQPGTVTPTNDNSLLVSLLATPDNGTYSIDSSFSIIDHIVHVGGQHYGGALAWLAQGAKTAVNPTWTVSAATLICSIAAFKHS